MEEKRERKIPKRIAGAVINSLKGGVVPRIGLPYIAVGRKNEIAAMEAPPYSSLLAITAAARVSCCRPSAAM